MCNKQPKKTAYSHTVFILGLSLLRVYTSSFIVVSHIMHAPPQRKCTPSSVLVYHASSDGIYTVKQYAGNSLMSSAFPHPLTPRHTEFAAMHCIPHFPGMVSPQSLDDPNLSFEEWTRHRVLTQHFWIPDRHWR